MSEEVTLKQKAFTDIYNEIGIDSDKWREILNSSIGKNPINFAIDVGEGKTLQFQMNLGVSGLGITEFK